MTTSCHLLLLQPTPAPNPSKLSQTNSRLHTVLEAQGLHIHPLSLTQITLSTPLPPLSLAFQQAMQTPLMPYWVFCTSQTGLQPFQTALNQGLLPKHYQLAVVGQQTAQAAQQLGLTVSFQPTPNTPAGAHHAALQFCQNIPLVQRLHVLWPCSQQAHPTLKQVLQQNNSTVYPWAVYTTQANPSITQAHVLTLLKQHPFQAALFTSSSSVNAWKALGLATHTPPLWLSLGSQTSQTIQQVRGTFPNLQAQTSSTPSLITLAQHLKQHCQYS